MTKPESQGEYIALVLDVKKKILNESTPIMGSLAEAEQALKELYATEPLAIQGALNFKYDDGTKLDVIRYVMTSGGVLVQAETLTLYHKSIVYRQNALIIGILFAIGLAVWLIPFFISRVN